MLARPTAPSLFPVAGSTTGYSPPVGVIQLPLKTFPVQICGSISVTEFIIAMGVCLPENALALSLLHMLCSPAERHPAGCPDRESAHVGVALLVICRAGPSSTFLHPRSYGCSLPAR